MTHLAYWVGVEGLLLVSRCDPTFEWTISLGCDVLTYVIARVGPLGPGGQPVRVERPNTVEDQ